MRARSTVSANASSFWCSSICRRSTISRSSSGTCVPKNTFIMNGSRRPAGGGVSRTQRTNSARPASVISYTLRFGRFSCTSTCFATKPLSSSAFSVG